MAEDIQPLTSPVKADEPPTPVEPNPAPPSWNAVTTSPKWASASPEEQLVTFSRWHDATYNYAAKQPFWQDPNQQDAFNTKASQIQSDLSQKAGGITPDEARVKLGQDAVSEAQNAATMAESTRPASAIERDALKPLHPDIASAYYANKAIPPPKPEGYFGQLINAPQRTLNTVTGMGANIVSEAVKSVGSVVGEGTGIPALETPFKGAASWLDDLSERLTTMGSEKGTTDPIAITLNHLYPGSTTAQIYGGVSDGTAKAVSQFVAPENLPLLATGGYGARTLAGVFTALGIQQLPQAIQQFNSAPDIQSKISIAAQTIVGIAAPAFGLKGHAAAKTDAMTELHNHLTQLPEEMLQAALNDPKVIPDLKASIQDALKAKEATETVPTVVSAAEEANAPKTAAEISPIVKETEQVTAPTAPEQPTIRFRKGKIEAPSNTTRDHFVNWYKSLPAADKTPDLIGAIKDAMKRNAAAAPETIVGPSLAGKVGKFGVDEHKDILEREAKGDYAGVSLEAFGRPHTFETSKRRQVGREEAFQLVRAEQERTGQQLLKPGVIEAVDAGTRPAELRSDDLLPRPEAKAEAPFQPGIPANLFTGTPEQAAHLAPDLLKAPLQKLGATFIRTTTEDGKTSDVSMANLDTLKGTGPFSEVKAGTKSKGKFLPIDQPITFREAPQPKAEAPAERGQEWNYPIQVTENAAKNAELFLDRTEPRLDAALERKQDLLDRNLPAPFTNIIKEADFGTLSGIRKFREDIKKLVKQRDAEDRANLEARIKQAFPKAEAPKPRPIPAWMLKDEEESKLTQGAFAREMKGRGRTPEQKELQIKVGSEHATTKALAQGYPDDFHDLHSFTGDSTAASALKKEIDEKLAKAYPPQKIPADAKQVMVQHKELGKAATYPTAELPTGEVDAKGKPITKMGTPFTNDALKVAAAFDEGKPQVVPQSLIIADKVNPAVRYDETTGKVTGVMTKYGFVENPGDLARLHEEHAITMRDKFAGYARGEKALAAAEGRVGPETGAEDIHSPEELGALGAGEELPQGKAEDLIAQYDAEEREKYNAIANEAERYGIDPTTIVHSEEPPPSGKAMPARPQVAGDSPTSVAQKHFDNLNKAGLIQNGRLGPNAVGTFLKYAATSKDVPKWLNFFAQKIIDSGLDTSKLTLKLINNPNDASGWYVPTDNYERADIQLNLGNEGYSGTYGTIIHEVFHHFLEPLLAAKRNGESLGPIRDKALQNLIDLRDEATRQAMRQIYKTEPTDADLKEFQRVQETNQSTTKYEDHPILSFFGDVSEVIKAFSDEPTMEMLASMKPDSRFPSAPGKLASLLHQIVSSIKSLFFNEPETKEDTLWAQMTNEMLTLMQKPYEGGAETRAGPKEESAKKVTGFNWDELAKAIDTEPVLHPKANFDSSKDGPKTRFTHPEAFLPPTNKIERPVLVDTDGKTNLTPNSKFGQSHASAAQTAFTEASPADKQKILAALQNGDQHMFEDSTGKILNRTDAAIIAKQSGQVHANSPNQLYTDVLNDRAGELAGAKAEAAKKSGGEIIESLGRGGARSHDVEIDPKASIDQLGALQNHIDEQLKVGKVSADDAAKMKAEVQGVLDQKQPFAPHIVGPQAKAAISASTGRIGALKDDLTGWWNRAKTAVQAAANKTFPRTTLADQASGEAMARWVASRTAAPFHSNRFIAHVLEGTDIDLEKYGTALTEDNLRSIAQNPERTGVGTTIGKKGSPFKTEKEYQDFLANPAVKQAIARHIAQWDEVVGPMYRQAMLLDPDVELASRGLQTGARVNLFAVKEGEKGGIATASGLRATLQRKSPFGRTAKGTGNYNTNYADMIANTFGQQLEIANKNEFEKQLVASGNAVIGKPGERPVLADGEATKGVPMRNLTLATEKGNIPLNRNLYIRDSLYAEYLRAADTDPNKVPELAQATAKILNRSALAGFTDFTVHGSNLFTALTTRPSVSGSLISDTLLSMTGRADVLVTFGKMWKKSLEDNQAQLEKLATIGALRDYIPAGQGKLNPLTWSGKALNWMDKTTRLMLDDAYQQMVNEEFVTDSETNRREFVNQVGQYNRRAQNRIVRAFRDSGIGPFATAGTTFNALGFRFAGMAPGVKASSALAAAALRANVMSKWAGAFTLVMGLNYMIVGKMTGRPGVPIGNVDTGRNNKNGQPLSIPVFDLLGAGRALRVTGIHGGLEAYRKGLTNSDIADSAVRDMYNAQISPFAGPPIRFLGSFANVSPFMGVPPPSPLVASGENQVKSNLENAVISANPIAASIREYRRGAGLLTAFEKQFPRFVPKATQPAQMMEHYPEIVRKAINSKFVDDVIRQARYMEPEERSLFVRDALSRIHDSGDRERAKKTLKYRRIQY